MGGSAAGARGHVTFIKETTEAEAQAFVQDSPNGKECWTLLDASVGLSPSISRMQ